MPRCAIRQGLRNWANEHRRKDCRYRFSRWMWIAISPSRIALQQSSSEDAQVDVLVNNAGIERHGSVEELPMEDFRATMETNYFGALRCIRQVLPGMRERGSGCIINVTSVAGKIACSPLVAYTASKFALEAASEALAQEMKPFGVRVAIVEPGIIDTSMAHAIKSGPPSRYRQGRAAGRVVSSVAGASYAAVRCRRSNPKHHRKRHMETASSGRTRCRTISGLEGGDDR